MEIGEDFRCQGNHNRNLHSAANLKAIASRALKHGINTSMLEWWSKANSYQLLHKDLKMGRNSAWQQGVLGGSRPSKTGLYVVDVSNPNNPVVTPQNITKFTRQYYKFIRPGTVRIEATSDNNAQDGSGEIGIGLL